MKPVLLTAKGVYECPLRDLYYGVRREARIWRKRPAKLDLYWRLDDNTARGAAFMATPDRQVDIPRLLEALNSRPDSVQAWQAIEAGVRDGAKELVPPLFWP